MLYAFHTWNINELVRSQITANQFFPFVVLALLRYFEGPSWRGGALAGVGIESSSFKYGFVHETILEIEILLPDGTVVAATKDNEHKDLLFGFANSYGTLGYALKVKVALIPVGKFVRLRHERYSDLETYFQALGRVCRDRQVDFVDGTMFDDRELYITTGEWVDQAEWLSD